MPRILSAMQYAAKNQDTPYDMLLPDMIPPFMEAWAGAIWDLENLALFNQAAYTSVSSRDRAAEGILVQHQQLQKLPIDPTDDFGYEVQQRNLANMRQAIMDTDLESDGIARYADEVTIIASWAFVEKQLNRALLALQSALGQPTNTDHRWPVIEAEYLQCGINLSQAKGFANADECRKVNNAIKHSGNVSAGLAALPAFIGMLNKPLASEHLDTQRYYFAAGEFVSSVLVKCSTIVKGLQVSP